MRLSRSIGMVATFAVFWIGTSRSEGCTVCRSESGRAVRQGIFDGRFMRNLALTASPFPLFLGLVVLIHSGFPGRRDQDSDPADFPATSLPDEESAP